MLLRNLNVVEYLCKQLSKKGWEKFEEKFKKLNAKGQIDSSTFNRLQNKIIESRNASWILDFAHLENANIELLLDAILKTKDYFLIPMFACTTNSDLSEVLQTDLYRVNIYQYLSANKDLIDNFVPRVIKTQNASYITYMLYKLPFADFSEYKKEINDIVAQSKSTSSILSLARNEKYADLDKLTDAIIEINKIDAIISMANIKGANQEKLFDAVLKNRDNSSIGMFIEGVYDKDVLKLQELVLKTNDPEKIFRFGVAEKEADYNQIVDALENSKSSEYLVELALELEKHGHADVTERILDIVIELKQPEAIYNARLIKSADLNMIIDSLIEANSAEYLYNIAYYVGLHNFNTEIIKKLAQAIINTNNEEYILKFMQSVENMPIESQILLVQKACEMNNLDGIYCALNNFKLEKLERERAVQAINAEGRTELVLNNSANSYTYACLADSISEDEKTALVETICGYGSSEQICAFAKNVDWLIDEHKEMLIGAICDRALRSNADGICWFAQNIDWLTPKDKSTLVKGAIASEDEKAIFYCGYYVDDLTDDDYKRLEFAINTINMNRVCDEIRWTREAIKEGLNEIQNALCAIDSSINKMSSNICAAISRSTENITKAMRENRPIINVKTSIF